MDIEEVKKALKFFVEEQGKETIREIRERNKREAIHWKGLN